MKEFKRILVVARMIQSCKLAIQHGVSLAQKYDAELFVLHSIHNPFSLKAWGLHTRELAREYDKSIADAKEKLAGLVKEEKAQGMAINEIVTEGEPTKEILKTIEEKKIHLLVMLAHEEGHIEHLLFGRSNDELMRKMPCSIMMIKKEPGPVAGVYDNE